MKSKKYILVSGLVLLAIIAGAYASVVSASSAQILGLQTASTEEPGTVVETKEPRHNGPDLTAAASTLGITAEVLQQALEDAKSTDCVEGEKCRPDLDEAAATLGISAEELQAALGRPEKEGPDFTAAASTLGITAEALQQALEDAKPTDCVEGEKCHPDLDEAAAALGITAEELQAALGRPEREGPDFTAAASTLGTTAEALQQALEDAKPTDCVEGEKCRPDLDEAAATLGITAEELQSVLGHHGDKPENGHKPQGTGQPAQDKPGNGQPPQR